MAAQGILTLNASAPPTTTGPNPVVPGSGTPNPFFNSAYRIIRNAMQNAGWLGDLQDPSSEDYSNYLPRLNDLINLRQTEGLKLWLQEDLSFPVQAGYNLYQIGPACTNLYDYTYFIWPRPPRILEAYWEYTFEGVVGNVRYPLVCLSRQEYDYLSTTTQQGNISNYFTDKQQNFTNIFLWLTPTSSFAASGVCHVLAQVGVNNLISLTDAMNFPQEWFLFLSWDLADEISQGQPLAVQQKCQMRAGQFKQVLEGWDVEDASTNFQPDQRTQYVGNKFI